MLHGKQYDMDHVWSWFSTLVVINLSWRCIPEITRRFVTSLITNRPIFRRDPNRAVPPTFPSRTNGHWQGRRSQQLCQGSLHGGQGTSGHCSGQDAETLRKLLRIARIPHLSFLWGWNWIWVYIPNDGTPLCGLWKEIETRIRSLPCSSG